MVINLSHLRFGSCVHVSLSVSPPLATLLTNSFSLASDIMWLHSSSDKKFGISEEVRQIMKKVPKLFVVFQMKFRHIFIPFISLNIVYLFLHLLADTVPSSNQIVDRTGSLDNQNQFFLISGHACAKRGELYVVWARVAEKIWPKVLNSLKCTLG